MFYIISYSLFFWICNCPEVAPKLPWRCPEVVLKYWQRFLYSKLQKIDFSLNYRQWQEDVYKVTTITGLWTALPVRLKQLKILKVPSQLQDTQKTLFSEQLYITSIQGFWPLWPSITWLLNDECAVWEITEWSIMGNSMSLWWWRPFGTLTYDQCLYVPCAQASAYPYM